MGLSTDLFINSGIAAHETMPLVLEITDDEPICIIQDTTTVAIRRRMWYKSEYKTRVMSMRKFPFVRYANQANVKRTLDA